MSVKKCLIRMTYKMLHDLLNLRDDVKIESVFVTGNDKMSDRVTVKLSDGPWIVQEGEMIPVLDKFEWGSITKKVEEVQENGTVQKEASGD